jgi:hypothetical protein
VFAQQERNVDMGKFLRTILIGVGIGLLIAPMPGQEMRRRLSERFQALLGSLPQNEQLNQYTQRVFGRTTPTEGQLKDVADTAMGSRQPDSLVTQPFKPAYPEYVSPKAPGNP